jgi:hypothetical protein
MVFSDPLAGVITFSTTLIALPGEIIEYGRGAKSASPAKTSKTSFEALGRVEFIILTYLSTSERLLKPLKVSN